MVQVIGQKPKHHADDLLFWTGTPLHGELRRYIAHEMLRVIGQKPKRRAGYLFFAERAKTRRPMVQVIGQKPKHGANDLLFASRSQFQHPETKKRPLSKKILRTEANICQTSSDLALGNLREFWIGPKFSLRAAKKTLA